MFPFLTIFRSITPFSPKFFYNSSHFKSFSHPLLINFFTHFHSPLPPLFHFLSFFLFSLHSHFFRFFFTCSRFLTSFLLFFCYSRPPPPCSFQRSLLFFFPLTSGRSFHLIRMQPVRNGTRLQARFAELQLPFINARLLNFRRRFRPDLCHSLMPIPLVKIHSSRPSQLFSC